MPRKVILDMDPGVDDAVALCLALASPELEVVAVTATGGNVGPKQASRNVQAIIERVDPTRWPRIGAADPTQDLRTDARDLHGPTGLAGVDLQVAEKANQHPSAKLMADEVRREPNEVTVIGTGPMSNLAALFELEPDAASMVDRVVVLGGSLSSGGNVTPAAEFNVYCDARAARAVFLSGVTPLLVPMDVSREMVFGYDLLDFTRGRASRTCRFLAEMLPGFYRAYRQRFGMESVCLHDLAAVIAVSHPELFTTERLHGDVELSGELTYGATVFDRRPAPDTPPNMDVAISIDAEAARDVLFRALARAA